MILCLHGLWIDARDCVVDDAKHIVDVRVDPSNVTSTPHDEPIAQTLPERKLKVHIIELHTPGRIKTDLDDGGSFATENQIR